MVVTGKGCVPATGTVGVVTVGCTIPGGGCTPNIPGADTGGLTTGVGTTNGIEGGAP